MRLLAILLSASRPAGWLAALAKGYVQLPARTRCSVELRSVRHRERVTLRVRGTGVIAHADVDRVVVGTARGGDDALACDGLGVGAGGSVERTRIRGGAPALAGLRVGECGEAYQ